MSRTMFLLLLTCGLLLGCKKDDHSDHDHGPGGHSHAGDSAKCEHQIADADCPFCHPDLIKNLGMCDGHGVPEALCTRCNDALIPAFKAMKDWCGEHSLPESQCTICNPDLKKPSAGKDEHEGHDHVHDDHGHAAESQGPKYGFEWGGVYRLPAGRVRVLLQPGPDDPSMKVTLLPVPAPSGDAIRAAAEQAEKVFSQNPKIIESKGQLAVGSEVYQLKLRNTPMEFELTVPVAGDYALFTEHFPHEFDTQLVAQAGPIATLAVVEFRESRVTLTRRAVEDSGIRLQKTGKHVLRETLLAPARVSFNAEAMAHVGSPLRGRVTELKAKLGDTVKKGDVLLTLDSPELGEAQLDFFQKRIAVAAAVPAIELAQNAYDRAKKLHEENNGISLAELQKRESELKVAQSSLTTAKAALTAAANRLHLMGMEKEDVETFAKGSELQPRFAIRAPISGQVVQREVTLGELVNPDREALLVLADTSTLWVLAEAPETRLSQITLGSPVTLTLASLGDRTFTGTVAYIAPSLNPVTRTATLRLEVVGDQSGLRPGMFAQAEIALGGGAESPPVLAVPEEAVQNIEGQPVVFVAAGEPNTFIKRPVKIGPPIGRMVQVHDGLKEGDPVVVAGSFILKADLGKAGAAHEH